MPDYEYGNARLRVMKSRLLAKHDLESLAEAGSLQGLIAALTKTVYQKSIETALTRGAGMFCIAEALKTDLVNTVAKIRGFYREDAGRMVMIFLRAYDIHNLKAILRGLSKSAPSGAILDVLLPVGELSDSLLRQLARLNSPREAIDRLASMGVLFARPLLNQRAASPGSEIFEMELALDQWYYEQAHQTLRGATGMADTLSAALALEADLANVLTVLRFAHFPRERDALRDRLGIAEIKPLFIGPGNISQEVLVSAYRQDTVAGAIETFSGTAYAPALRAGLDDFARSKRLSDIERRIKHCRLQWMAGQITRDPLGIGVVLGYVALKINEINNIRWIAQGINLGLSVPGIRAELEMVL